MRCREVKIPKGPCPPGVLWSQQGSVPTGVSGSIVAWGAPSDFPIHVIRVEFEGPLKRITYGTRPQRDREGRNPWPGAGTPTACSSRMIASSRSSSGDGLGRAPPDVGVEAEQDAEFTRLNGYEPSSSIRAAASTTFRAHVTTVDALFGGFDPPGFARK